MYQRNHFTDIPDTQPHDLAAHFKGQEQNQHPHPAQRNKHKPYNNKGKKGEQNKKRKKKDFANFEFP